MTNGELNRRTLLAGTFALAGTLAGGQLSQGAAAASPNRWRLLSDADGPAARWDHTLTAADADKQLVLFGGRGADFAALGDTWLYSLTDKRWQAVDAAGPSPRFGHAVAVDQAARRLYLFGGQAGEEFYNDSWAFDLDERTWSQIDIGNGAAPSPRYGLGAVLDDGGQLVVSHGFTFDGRFDDTWALDLARGEWSDVSPTDGTRPLKRCLHEMVWDEPSARMLLFGGCSSGFGPCPQGDLWAFDPWERVWTQLDVGDGPTARSNPAMLFDAKGKRSLLIGGLTDAGYAADVWSGSGEGDAFSWRARQMDGAAPSARASHDAVMTRGDVYLFGGTGDAGPVADLWKLEFTDDE